MMLRLFLYSLVALSFAFVIASDLKSDLKAAGVTALFPGDPNYASSSTAYNLRFTFKPAAIAYPTTVNQVSSVVKVGATRSMRVVARSGGHSYIANGLGGKNGVLVVDLGKFTKVTYNPSKKTAVIESGNRLGDIALALNQNGRALPHGVCPYVGIGGHAGYGGFGFTSRLWGLTLDTITSANVILANGTITTASGNTNSDLFWALRGSAGSFGIVTSIEVRTFTPPPSAIVFEYQWDFNVPDLSKGLAAWQTFVQTNIPAEFGGEINLRQGSTSGTVSFAILGGWYGAANKLNATIAPLLAAMPRRPENTKLTPGTYIDSVTYLAGGSLDTHTAPDIHDNFYAKSLMTPMSTPMSQAALTAFASYIINQGPVSNTSWFMQVELYGGPNSAINAVNRDATSFAHRSSMFTIQFYASALNINSTYPKSGFTFMDGAVNSIVSNSPSNWDYGAYPNYIEDRLPDGPRRYYGSHYPRLQSLKAKYDPKDTFTFPTAIET